MSTPLCPLLLTYAATPPLPGVHLTASQQSFIVVASRTQTGSVVAFFRHLSQCKEKCYAAAASWIYMVRFEFYLGGSNRMGGFFHFNI